MYKSEHFCIKDNCIYLIYGYIMCSYACVYYMRIAENYKYINNYIVTSLCLELR